MDVGDQENLFLLEKKKKKKMEGEELNTNQENVLLLEKNEKKNNNNKWRVKIFTNQNWVYFGIMNIFSCFLSEGEDNMIYL